MCVSVGLHTRARSSVAFTSMSDLVFAHETKQRQDSGVRACGVRSVCVCCGGQRDRLLMNGQACLNVNVTSDISALSNKNRIRIGC